MMKLIFTTTFTKVFTHFRTNDNFLRTSVVLTNGRWFTSAFQENKVAVDGIKINYVKTGSGPKSILCLPGGLGSIWSDFKPQVEGLDKSKFTVVAWDPPGYGNSRPPIRDFSQLIYHRDADWAVKLMQALSIGKFSMLGWSAGGISAMIAAAKYPEHIDKLVIWGANAYITDQEAKIFESIRDISKWSEHMKAPLIKLYGEEGLAAMCSQWVDTLLDIYKNKDGDTCKDCLSEITCPTLIINGKKDTMLAPEHPGYLLKHIRHSKLHTFEGGRHNLHMQYADEFNNLVTEFLSE